MVLIRLSDHKLMFMADESGNIKKPRRFLNSGVVNYDE